VVGAPLAPAGTVPRVGRLYVYRGCRPALIDRAAPPGSAPRPPLRPGLRLCTTLVPWFRLHQTDFQSPSLTTPAAPITGIPGTPLFPPFTENVTDDRVGAAVAVVPAAAGTRASVLAGAPGKALGRRNDAGAVFRFLPSLTPDQPPFRNQTALTSDFTTRVDRD